VYAAFLLKNTGDSPGGDYFAHFHRGTENTVFRCRVFGRQSQLDPNKVEFGGRYGSAGGIMYNDAEPVELPINETGFLVVKFTMVPGENNDELALYLNPNLDQGEPTPDLLYVNPGDDPDIDPDAHGIGWFSYRESASGGQTGDWEIDELRIATTWAEVVTSVGPPEDLDPPQIVEVVPPLDRPVVGSLTKVVMSLDEVAVGLEAGDLTIGGSPATVLTEAGTTYTFEGFATPGVGSHDVEIPAGAFADVWGNAFPGYNVTLEVLNPATAGLLLYEPFDYAGGEALTDQADWTGGATAGSIVTEASGSLSYPGLPSGQGGRLIVTEGGSGGALRRAGTVLGEGRSMYFSMIYTPTGASGNSYWAHSITQESTQSQLGRFRTNDAADPNHTFESQFRTSASSTTEAGSHPHGVPVFLVGKTTMVPGADNDTFSMWINPAVGVAEPAPTLLSTETGNDIDPIFGIQGFAFRISSSTGDYELDELRIGATWESVTPSASADVEAWQLYK